MRTLIFLGGNYNNSDFYKKNIKRDDFIIAADGGSNFLFKIKKLPNMVVGDLDSISKNILRWISRNKIPVKKYRTDKDYTDFELALDFAVKSKPKEIIVFGCFGSRRDHEYSTLMVISKYLKSGKNILLEDESKIMFFARPNLNNKIPVPKGKTISLIPFDNKIENVKTSGLLYPLKNESLYRNSSRAVSNMAVANNPTIYLKKGLLLIIINKKLV